MSDLCAAATLPPRPGRPDGSVCREWDGRDPGWAAAGPLCETEIRVAERDVRMLPFDYLDLEQALPPTLSQALDSQSQYAQRGSRPALVREGVEAQQRTIWWVTTAWAEVLTERFRLADPPYQQRHRDGDAPTRVRDGFAVQWAVGLLTPRIADLARVDAVEMADYPLADDDALRFKGVERTAVAGWEAVLHLSLLHQRARSMLGRTRRTEHLPGDCSGCGAADLRRDEPRDFEDPCAVYCGGCARSWSRDEYDRYVRLMVWPGMVAA